MTMTATKRDELEALREGRAFARLPDRRIIEVRGADAPGWLHDLMTADVEGLERGAARRSFLLTPTGRIRADVTVARLDDGLVLIQTSDQPAAIDRLLAPYVLSSAVELDDATSRSSVFLVTGDTEADAGSSYAPSGFGEGREVVVPGDEAELLRKRCLAAGLADVGADALERWRIERGIARYPVDLTPESLPNEIAIEGIVDVAKGCFLGQEAVAKVRNLGHPPFVVRAVRSSGRLTAGEPVVAAGEAVGAITSRAPDDDGGSVAMARIRWRARDQDLETGSGMPLELRPAASGSLPATA